jgi:septum formation protein
MKNFRIILASNSPRRKELLAGLDIPFEVKVIQGIDESFPESLPAYDTAQYIAVKKAQAYRPLLDSSINHQQPSDGNPELLILTADTVVIAPSSEEQNDQEGKGIILGKPKDAADASRMLEMLSGKTHHVVTGVCITSLEKQRQFSVVTEVTFKKLSKEEIDYYVGHYKPFDKAGAYGIQEWIGYIGCTSLKGSYFNVMGLPVQRIYEELKKF